MPYPPQMAIPAPTAAYPAQQHGTITAAGSSLVTTLPGYAAGGQSLQHPQGYQQDANAASGLDRYQASAAQRGGGGGGGGAYYSPAATAGADSEQGRQSPEEGVWDTAKKWAQATGQKLAAAEGEVWKRINKE